MQKYKQYKLFNIKEIGDVTKIINRKVKYPNKQKS